MAQNDTYIHYKHYNIWLVDLKENCIQNKDSINNHQYLLSIL